MRKTARPARPLHAPCMFAALCVFSFAASNSARAQRVWLQQGPGPNTVGQVEGITNREVVGAIKRVALTPTDSNIALCRRGERWHLAHRQRDGGGPHLDAADRHSDQSARLGAMEFDPTDATRPDAGRGPSVASSSLLGHRRVATRGGVWRTRTTARTWTLIERQQHADGNQHLRRCAAGQPPSCTFGRHRRLGCRRNRGVWRSTDTGVDLDADLRLRRNRSAGWRVTDLAA